MWKVQIHGRCSKIKGKIRADLLFKCSVCEKGVAQTITEEEGDGGLGDKFERVESFCYLGDVIGAGGGAGDASRARVRCAWAKFNELGPILTARGASLKLKGRLYKIQVQTVLVYGSETWPAKVEDIKRLERAERTIVRWMCGVTLKNRCKSEDLLSRLGIDSVEEVVRRRRLRWYGHVERKEKNDWVSACRYLEVEGSFGRGRRRMRWEQVIEKDMRKKGVNKQMAQELWREVIVGNRPTHAGVEKRTYTR